MIMSRAGRAKQENGAIFEALRTMSACYLRADTAAICACIQTFALNDLLFSIARLERLFNKRSCNGASPPHGLVADVLGAALDGRLQSQPACIMAFLHITLPLCVARAPCWQRSVCIGACSASASARAHRCTGAETAKNIP